MLASLSISQWSARKYDRKVSQEVADKHGMSDSQRGRYTKTLVAKKALDKITKIAGAARNEFYELSLPWRDDGSRILTSAAYFQLADKMRKRSAEIEDAEEEFLAEYPALVAQAEIDLNGLFLAADYPSISDIKTKFRFAFHVNPLPIADDFRVNLSDDETNLIKQQIETTLQESVKIAMQDVWLRMKDVVTKMAEKLKAYKVTNDGVENPFRDSLVTNMRDLLSILPALNLTNDTEVTRFASQMQTLCQYEANQLRDNDGRRELVAQAAEDILSKMSQFV